MKVHHGSNSEHLRFVAHLDILGFRTIALHDEKTAWGVLSDFYMAKSEIEKSVVFRISGHQLLPLDRVRFVLFSDTILAYSLSDTLDDLSAMVVYCSHLFSILLAKCVPIRGGIGYGKFYFNPDQQLYFGLPFIEAHSLGESAQWLGIVISDSFIQKYITLENHKSKTESLFIQWDVPQKNGLKEKRWVINWPTLFQKSFAKQFPITVDDFYQAFKGMFGDFESLDSKIQQKYINTVEFINSQLQTTQDSKTILK